MTKEQPRLQQNGKLLKINQLVVFNSKIGKFIEIMYFTDINFRSNGLCLSVDKKSGGGNPDLAFESCSSSSRYQQWFFKD